MPGGCTAGGWRDRTLQGVILRHRIGPDRMASQSQQVCDGAVAGGALVGVQGYRATGDEYVWIAVHHATESRRVKGYCDHFYGGPMETKGTMGFALSMDAV